MSLFGRLTPRRRSAKGFSGPTLTLIYDQRFDGFELIGAPDLTEEQRTQNELVNAQVQQFLDDEDCAGRLPSRS